MNVSRDLEGVQGTMNALLKNFCTIGQHCGPCHKTMNLFDFKLTGLLLLPPPLSTFY